MAAAEEFAAVALGAYCGEADERRFGISFASLHGLWFVAGSLVRDVAALNKMEMAPWDVWGAQPAPQEEFDPAYFDALAALTRGPDYAFAGLRRRYEKDDNLRVPTRVFNALNQRHEAIDAPTDSSPRNALGAGLRHAEVDIHQ